jgi:hypothetical protein
MSPVVRMVGRYLAVPLGIVVAGYMSIISAELLADNYGLIVDPVAPDVAPGEPGLARDLDSTGVERTHREKITTRTVRCIQGCTVPEQWGTFLALSNEKQNIDADPDRRDPAQRSEDRIITAGIDRLFGKHLVGFSLGASDGEGQTERIFANDGEDVAGLIDLLDRSINTERDKYTAGVYYGLQLPYYVTLSATVRANQDRYSSYWTDYSIGLDRPREDSARYNGDGYSGAVALSAIVPLISGDFSFMFQPSISYQTTRSETDPYISELSVDYGPRSRRSKDLGIAAKWQAPFIAAQTVVLPFGGFSYSHLERRSNVEDQDGGRLIVVREHDLVEGLLGVTVQHRDFSATAMYEKTIGSDELERERYRLILRLRF